MAYWINIESRGQAVITAGLKMTLIALLKIFLLNVMPAQGGYAVCGLVGSLLVCGGNWR